MADVLSCLWSRNCANSLDFCMQKFHHTLPNNFTKVRENPFAIVTFIQIQYQGSIRQACECRLQQLQVLFPSVRVYLHIKVSSTIEDLPQYMVHVAERCKVHSGAESHDRILEEIVCCSKIRNFRCPWGEVPVSNLSKGPAYL